MKNFILSMVAVVTLGCCCASCGQSVPSASFKGGELDTLAYAYGVLFGTQYSNFQDSGVVVPEKTMNLDNFLAGFVTAIRRDSSALKMSAEDANLFLQTFQMKLRAEMEAKQQEALKAEKAKGADFMAANAQKEGVNTLESGLQLQVITEGTGKAPKENDNVLVNYKGTLVDGTQFDGRDSTSFNVNGVVKGFKEALLSMKEGGKVIATMPSELGYGDRAMGKDIPAGATLVFELELLKVNP